MLGGLKLRRVRLDPDHLQSAALLVQPDAHVFQSAMDVGGLKSQLVGSAMSLVRPKKAQVESAVRGIQSATLGIQSAAHGIQSDERGFQSAACLFRLAACNCLKTARDFPSAAPGRLFVGAGGVRAIPGLRTAHVLNTVKTGNRRRDIFVRPSFSSGARQATLRSRPTTARVEAISRSGAMSGQRLGSTMRHGQAFLIGRKRA